MVLCFLLLGGKSNSYAFILICKNLNTTSIQNFSHKKQIKTVNEDHNILLIEDTDLDLEEEYPAANSVKGSTKTNFFIGKYILLNTLYSIKCQYYTSNNCNKRIKRSPFLFGNPYPIYITQRVLRI